MGSGLPSEDGTNRPFYATQPVFLSAMLWSGRHPQGGKGTGDNPIIHFNNHADVPLLIYPVYPTKATTL